MIQDIAPHALRNEFVPGARPKPGDTVFRFAQGKLIGAFREGALRLPTWEALGKPRVRYLFSLDGNNMFLCLDADGTVPEGMEPLSVRALRTKDAAGRPAIFAAWTAWQLANWYLDNRYCGRCGGETEDAADERCIVCPACGRRIYPRIIPAVIVGVTDGDRLLLTRYNRPGAYHALVAGFTEIGETLEETVRREVKEETGLDVEHVRYYKSQPWGIVDDLLAGFFCDVTGDTEIRMDDRELKEAVWTCREDIDGQPDSFSLTNEMMMLFKAGLEPKWRPEPWMAFKT